MKLILVSGFLGSGKTTLLLELVQQLQQLGDRRFVIIENEIGEVSVDGRYLARTGLAIRELFGGCVCCQLSGDLVSTLDEVRHSLNPDCVFLEASGLAVLQEILSTIDRFAPYVQRLVLYLVDLERWGGAFKDSAPFIIGQLERADILILNKTDCVGAGDLAGVAAEAKELNPTADVLLLSLYDGRGMEELTRKVSSWV